MGCDIHIYTEVKDSDGNWRSVDFYTPNEYYEAGTAKEDEAEFELHEFYSRRSYELFTALAGVRGKPVKSLEPKGFPQDASGRVRKTFDRWGSGAHTPSYLTLKELYVHRERLGDIITRTGVISPLQFKELQEGIKPISWCAGTSDREWIEVTWEDEFNPMDEFLEKLNSFLSLRFWDYERPKEDSEDFRVVFWFDN